MRLTSLMLVLVLASQEAVAPPPRHLHRPDQDQHDLNNNIDRGDESGFAFLYKSLGDYMDAYGERVEQGDGDPGHDKPGGTSGRGHHHDDQPAGLHSHNWEDNHEGPEGGNEDDEEENTFDYDAAFLVEDMMPDQEGTPETEEEADSFGEFTESLNGDQDLLSSAIFKSVSEVTLDSSDLVNTDQKGNHESKADLKHNYKKGDSNDNVKNLVDENENPSEGQYPIDDLKENNDETGGYVMTDHLENSEKDEQSDNLDVHNISEKHLPESRPAMFDLKDGLGKAISMMDDKLDNADDNHKNNSEQTEIKKNIEEAKDMKVSLEKADGGTVNDYHSDEAELDKNADKVDLKAAGDSYSVKEIADKFLNASGKDQKNDVIENEEASDEAPIYFSRISPKFRSRIPDQAEELVIDKMLPGHYLVDDTADDIAKENSKDHSGDKKSVADISTASSPIEKPKATTVDKEGGIDDSKEASIIEKSDVTEETGAEFYEEESPFKGLPFRGPVAPLINFEYDQKIELGKGKADSGILENEKMLNEHYLEISRQDENYIVSIDDAAYIMLEENHTADMSSNDQTGSSVGIVDNKVEQEGKIEEDKNVDHVTSDDQHYLWKESMENDAESFKSEEDDKASKVSVEKSRDSANNQKRDEDITKESSTEAMKEGFESNPDAQEKSQDRSDRRRTVVLTDSLSLAVPSPPDPVNVLVYGYDDGHFDCSSIIAPRFEHTEEVELTSPSGPVKLRVKGVWAQPTYSCSFQSVQKDEAKKT